MSEALEFGPGPTARTVRDAKGGVVDVPAGWSLLPPGDAGLTRRVKAAGATWVVKEKKGRRVFSQGLWAPAATIEAEQARLEAERARPEYRRKLEAARARRDVAQAQYEQDFEAEVRAFLGFDAHFADVEAEMARRIADQSTGVGSGTVGRTKRLTIEAKAEAAVIAWMRHHTTAYEHTQVERRKGARRELRRKLAQRSRSLLESYRRGTPAAADCPLAAALAKEHAVILSKKAERQGAAKAAKAVRTARAVPQKTLPPLPAAPSKPKGSRGGWAHSE